MRKWKTSIVGLLTAGLLLGGCGSAPDISFIGKVESVDGQSIQVTTADTVGFDRASVLVTERTVKNGVELSALKAGDMLKIRISPEIRESYPVQVTALEITYAPIERKLTAQQARQILEQESDYVLLDVRTEAEFAAGHIKGARLIPDTELAARAEKELPDKHQLILVYCRSGRRSAAAMEKLVGMGYTRVYDFGGIIDWPYEVVTE